MSMYKTIDAVKKVKKKVKKKGTYTKPNQTGKGRG